MFLGRLMVFSAGYATLAPVFPILATTPRYLAGAVTLGGLMQVAQAFQQVTVALSWPVDNFARIAEWRASVDRALALCLAMEELDAELAEIGSGTARIERPEGDDGLAFLGPAPWLPAGTLREALRHPAGHAAMPDTALREALARIGLPHLAGRLGEAAAWEHELPPGDRQRLGLTRLLLHRPAWVLLHDATDALDPQAEEAAMRALVEVLPGATILAFGWPAAPADLFHRTLTLEREPDGAVLIHETRARRVLPRPIRHPGPVLD
jgi:vitamin B12/bleomycin/antimicrobial peptide transport system ATP-binding/permease protein